MITTVLMTAMAVLLGVASAGAAPAGKACSLTASATREACRNGAKGELWIGVGNCQNLPDKVTRRTCRAAARDALAESKQECAEQFAARQGLCDALGQEPYDPQIDPASFRSPADTAAHPNPYFPLVPGTTWVYQSGAETVTVTVTSETKLIQGVTTTIVHDVAAVGGMVSEDTEDYFAQQLDGTVWYFGELSKSFTDGELVDLHGSFKAGRDGAKAGTIMPAAPAVGDVYRQEFALGIAEDAAEILSTTGSESAPGGSCAGACLVTRDLNPLDPGSEEHKYYAPGIGLIVTVDLASGEREELMSVSP